MYLHTDARTNTRTQSHTSPWYIFYARSYICFSALVGSSQSNDANIRSVTKNINNLKCRLLICCKMYKFAMLPIHNKIFSYSFVVIRSNY